MKWCYVKFRSITRAQGGQQILNRRGISSRLVRTPRNIAPRGCGYSLMVPEENLSLVSEILKNEGVSFETDLQTRKVVGI